MILIQNVRPVINGKLENLSNVLIKDNYIYDILPANVIPADCEIVNMNGAICASGYIDIHTHGGNGHDIMEGTIEAISSISQFHLNTGTTTYIPTTLTADIPTTIQAINNVRNYQDTNTARRFGVHLEGPYISLKAPGAHPVEYILTPSTSNTQWIWDNSDIISRITIAPDQANSDWLTKQCVEHNIQVSAGHDSSIDDEINSMIEQGCTSVTHMYNCTSRCSRRTTPHKHLGLTEVGLTSNQLICEVIADDRHVPNPLFNMIFKLKNIDGIALVSDSLAIAGYFGGVMYLGSGKSKQRIEVQDGVAVIPELNTYAGSITPISKEVQNLVMNLNISIEQAITMGTLTPAKLMNMQDRGDIQINYLADINILDYNGNIIHTFFDGKQIK